MPDNRFHQEKIFCPSLARAITGRAILRRELANGAACFATTIELIDLGKSDL